jgi:hypothetical protein
MTGGGPPFRGNSEGVSWNCAQDADISNHRTDCSVKWNGGRYGVATSPGALHTSGLLGEVRWDVTDDVLAGAAFGWLIRKREEGPAGQVRYYSLEGARNAPNLAPRLVLVYRR